MKCTGQPLTDNVSHCSNAGWVSDGRSRYWSDSKYQLCVNSGSLNPNEVTSIFKNEPVDNVYNELEIQRKNIFFELVRLQDEGQSIEESEEFIINKYKLDQAELNSIKIKGLNGNWLDSMTLSN